MAVSNGRCLLARTADLEVQISGVVRSGGVIPRIEVLEKELAQQGVIVAAVCGLKPRLAALEAALEASRTSPLPTPTSPLSPQKGTNAPDAFGLFQPPERHQQDEEDEGEATDPDMPTLVPVACKTPVLRRQDSDGSMGHGLVWAALPEDLEAPRVKPDLSDLVGVQLSGEQALLHAEDLLKQAEDDDEEEPEEKRLQAIASLREAVCGGCKATVEGAVALLLHCFRRAKGAVMLDRAVEALADCETFPAPLAAHASRLLMLRPEWPERPESCRQLCHTVACSSPSEVLHACLELVPRKHTQEMLGFSWLLEPLVEDVAQQFEVGDRVIVMEDMTTDNRQGVQLKKGTEGEIREIDDEGDLSIRFRDVEKRQWVRKRHSYRIGFKGSKGDSLPAAVTLLCDDAGGGPLCAASARALLMRMSERVGMNALQRNSKDENLVRKAHQVKVRDTLVKLKAFQGVSASE